MATTLLGPGAVNAKFACERAADPEHSRPLYLEMLKLVLGKIGAYWELGALILGEQWILLRSPIPFGHQLTVVSEIVQMLEARRSVTELVNSRKNDLDQFPFLIPKGDDLTAEP